MTVKMMSGKQVNFLRELVEKRAVTIEQWAEMTKDLNIEEEDDLYHLNVEQASKVIYTLIKMPDK